MSAICSPQDEHTLTNEGLIDHYLDNKAEYDAVGKRAYWHIYGALQPAQPTIDSLQKELALQLELSDIFSNYLLGKWFFNKSLGFYSVPMAKYMIEHSFVIFVQQP
jgi:hypothetical protein